MQFLRYFPPYRTIKPIFFACGAIRCKFEEKARRRREKIGFLTPKITVFRGKTVAWGRGEGGGTRGPKYLTQEIPVWKLTVPPLFSEKGARRGGTVTVISPDWKSEVISPKWYYHDTGRLPINLPLKLKNPQIFNNVWRGFLTLPKNFRMFVWGVFNFAKKNQNVWGGFYNVGPKIAKKIAPSARFPLVKSVFMNPKTHFFRAFGAISPCKIGIYNPKSHFFAPSARFSGIFVSGNLTFHVFK